jgi:uracil-DNA glycosylase
MFTPAAAASTPPVVGDGHALPLDALVPPDWRAVLADALSAPTFQALTPFLDEESKKGKVFPPREQIFNALKETPLQSVKVVILGQDPYPTAGVANGLAFSVSPGVKIPPSLRNIDLALAEELGVPKPVSGDLTPWARQGVLLLNTVNTVLEGAPNSHRGQGWEAFNEAVLKKVNEQPGPVVFLCFGVPAKAMAERIVDTLRHSIISTPHPSPLNGKKFVETVKRERSFQAVNAVLVKAGRPPIDWRR